jgi:hypothetical protein
MLDDRISHKSGVIPCYFLLLDIEMWNVEKAQSLNLILGVSGAE